MKTEKVRMIKQMEVSLAKEALEMAYFRRRPGKGSIIRIVVVNMQPMNIRISSNDMG